MTEKKTIENAIFFSKPPSIINSLSNLLIGTSSSYNIFDIAHYINKLLKQSEIEEILSKM
jgi:hypothetical protein